MREGFIALAFFCILSFISHFLKKYLDVILIRQKEKFQKFNESREVKNKLNLNIEKAKIESLEIYNKWLGYGKWIFLFLGILAFAQSTFI